MAAGLIWLLIGTGGGTGRASPISGLRVSVLDVGQGDAILLQPAGAPPILVDTGPPGDGIAAELDDAGVERLGALILTHDQSDHDGAEDEVLAAAPGRTRSSTPFSVAAPSDSPAPRGPAPPAWRRGR